MDGKYDGPAIGIDLGTTFSCIGVWQHGKVEIITNDQGNRVTPSCVAFTNAMRLIGDAAINQVAMNSANTIFDTKRLIGRRFTDDLVQKDMKLWPFKISAGEDDKPMINVQYKGKDIQFSPEEISAMVLTKMREIAETYLGKKVKNVVVTVPAYFNDLQRQATKDAGVIAGLNIIRLINEPTAAAIAYGFDSMDRRSLRKNILIFDLGGGTLDVSLLTIEDGKFEVKSTAGDTHLGGQDFDNRLMEHCVMEIKRKHKIDISGKPRSLSRLRTSCEKAKRSLSNLPNTTVFVECLLDGEDYEYTITQAKFEKINDDLFNKCLEPVGQCLKDAGIDRNCVDEVVLVGGSTRIHMIQKLLREFFNGKEPRKNINPDEAVAYGATLQAALLTGEKSEKLENIILLDVTPLSLGVEINGWVMSVVIPRNTKIPVKKSKSFSTLDDDQTFLPLKIYQGERSQSVDNILLAEFKYEGIPPAPRGHYKIMVTFDIDKDGILHVSAENNIIQQTTGITITNVNGSLTTNQVKRMTVDADEYSFEDQQFLEIARSKNSLERCIYDIGKNIKLNDFSSKLNPIDKEKIDNAIDNVTKLLEANHLTNASDFDNERKNLESIWNSIVDQ